MKDKQCKYLFKLYKHPSNKDDQFKGSVLSETGYYACLMPEWDKNTGCLFDGDMAKWCINGEGGCECYKETGE